MDSFFRHRKVPLPRNKSKKSSCYNGDVVELIELAARIKFYSPFYSPSLMPIGTNQCQEKGGVSGGVGAKNPVTQALSLDMTGFQVFYDCSGWDRTSDLLINSELFYR